jgi:hypothetical protein
MRLRELDDRLLSDIGVERGDIDWALSLPKWKNCEDELYRRTRQTVRWE